MKPRDLTNKEINDIFEDASKRYALAPAKRERNFLCECVVQAFIDYCATKKYVVSNGKIYGDQDVRRK